MPENPIPPSSDDDSDDLSAFDDFVNKHLDFESSTSRSAHGSSDDTLFDDDEIEDFDDDDEPRNSLPGPPPPPPFGSIFNRAGAPQRPPFSGSSALPYPPSPGMPPRNPLPNADDRRWINGYYKVKSDLEIHQTLPFMTSRVLIVTNANRRWNKRVRFIPNIAPGWAAIELRTGSAAPIRGYVRAADVKFIPSDKMPNWSKMAMVFHLDWFDLLVITVVMILFLFLLTDVDETLFYSAKPHVEALQTQVAEQQARIEALEAQLSSGNASRTSDR